ncbi:MAG: ABC transporter permease [Cyclobacteriaceae bacterium]|nr:ABC transporter permease [Cyclobacteriaceae bacterium]
MSEKRINTPHRFLRWFSPPHLLEEIEGDLMQRFERDVKSVGERKAKRRLLWNTIRFLRPGIILRGKKSTNINSFDMFINHIVFAWRIFKKEKFHSLLNVSGLALAITVGIILVLILQHDLTYDQHHLNHSRIYRLGARQEMTGDDFHGAITARELGPVVQAEFSQIEKVTRIEVWGRTLLTLGDNESKSFYEEEIIRTDSTYFDLFTHQFLAGDKNSCLTDLNSIVLTNSAAQKYFGTTDVIGKAVLIENKEYAITAVIKDLPENSHLKFKLLISGIPDRDWFDTPSESFWNPDVYTYLLVKEGFDPNQFSVAFQSIYNKYLKSTGDRIEGKYTPILEPLASIHFHSTLKADFPQGNKMYLYTLVGVGVFIILLACINYMNLATAKSTSRSKEVAIKKTLGSVNLILIASFFVEAIFLSLISFLFALVLIKIILEGTPFNQLIGKNLAFDIKEQPQLLTISLAIAFAIGCLAGSYPALSLSRIPALKSIQVFSRDNFSGTSTRRILIGIQFAVSFFVVTSTLFMQDQIDYVRSRNLGFEKENVLVVPIQDTTIQKQIVPIQNEILKNPNILSVTTSQSVIGMTNTHEKWGMWAESKEGMKVNGFTVFFVGENYLETMGIELKAGRDFLVGEQDMLKSFLANEAAVKAMGWEDAIGKKVKFYQAKEDAQVIGVVKDFNFASLHSPIEPALICKIPQEHGFLQVRIRGNVSEAIQSIQSQWKAFDSAYPFEYYFLDKRFDDQYKSDSTQIMLMNVLSYLCIFISILGLIGLSSFHALRRTKEFGIRKVLGARTTQLISLLSREAIVLIVVASLIAVPASIWASVLWKEGFAFRSPINYLLIVLVFMGAITVVFSVVFLQSYRVARANPVDSLKYE